jgi:catechol 2,3-dioxygenase-like lactoylglutathione lyase family enzyme
MNTPPFGALRYLYIGSADFDRDLKYYREVLGAERAWQFHHFGARVAALRLGEGPLLLLADHRPAPSCMPVFAVVNLETAARDLSARGWNPEGDRFEIPNGPCRVFHDPSGNPFALFEDARPNAMENAYADPSNTHAVRD